MQPKIALQIWRNKSRARGKLDASKRGTPTKGWYPTQNSNFLFETGNAAWPDTSSKAETCHHLEEWMDEMFLPQKLTKMSKKWDPGKPSGPNKYPILSCTTVAINSSKTCYAFHRNFQRKWSGFRAVENSLRYPDSGIWFKLWSWELSSNYVEFG